ncbi:pyranose dehydrogenase [Mycena albidolilacea]|uniref:Pyranose dehydrogenase n=1 Tax=Mycena albidolilacea TaxID=1033008 RepID=A0AAD6YW59_9AGAR|nr:pyranose dehydrogenase [Mycena albidolilacea]KAJ7350064.1 pyranose dehydrogenase [Mycena albidolilacea]
MLRRALVTLVYLAPCFGKVYEDVSQLPGLSYDFVVVGGGTAGNVVENRLTENPDFTVLVLEAGVSNEGVIDSIVPFFVTNLLQPNIYEWNYTTVPQPGLNGRNVGNPRAHILGGCSTHNEMGYTRGSADDYDRFAAVTGDPGWSWDRLLPYFFKNEKWTPPVDQHDTRGQYNPAVHSTNGIDSVSLSGSNWPIFSRHIIEATKQLPNDWSFNLDMNSGKPLGLGWIQTTIGGGMRSSSATSYLGPEFIHRKNLHVLLHAQVSKLADASRANGKLSFGGVQFLQGGKFFTGKAANEIILSAGSVGTPGILMHSGIGDQAALTALKTPTLLDLPSVGQNATDQPSVGLGWTVNSTQTLDSISQNSTRFDEAFAEWNRSHTGPFSAIGTTHMAWLRLAPEELGSNGFTDQSAGPDSPHIEPGGFGAPPGSHSIAVWIVVLNPLSRGSVTINSSDPFESPVIDVGFLQSNIDVFTGREAIKKVLNFFKAPIWRDYIIAPIVDVENLTDDALDQFIRNSASAAFHLVGTAAMSAKGARYGVVDSDLRVKGVSRLRIIDASVFPFVPSSHTQAGTYAIAERGADLVKKAWA